MYEWSSHLQRVGVSLYLWSHFDCSHSTVFPDRGSIILICDGSNVNKTRIPHTYKNPYACVCVYPLSVDWIKLPKTRIFQTMYLVSVKFIKTWCLKVKTCTKIFKRKNYLMNRKYWNDGQNYFNKIFYWFSFRFLFVVYFYSILSFNSISAFLFPKYYMCERQRRREREKQKNETHFIIW